MSDAAKTSAAPRWRVSRFGNSLELMRRRAGGGPAIWLGSVGPALDDGCSYSTPLGSGQAASQVAAQALVEAQHGR